MLLYWLNQLEGALPNKLPWGLWTKYIISMLPFDAFDREPKAITCATCNASNPTTQCGRCKAVFYCGRDCQKAHWSSHRATCQVNAREVGRAEVPVPIATAPDTP